MATATGWARPPLREPGIAFKEACVGVSGNAEGSVKPKGCMRKAGAEEAVGPCVMLPKGGLWSSSSSSKFNGARVAGNPNPRGCCTAAAGNKEYVDVLGNAFGTWNAGKAGAAVAGAIGVVMRMARLCHTNNTSHINKQVGRRTSGRSKHV